MSNKLKQEYYKEGFVLIESFLSKSETQKLEKELVFKRHCGLLRKVVICIWLQEP